MSYVPQMLKSSRYRYFTNQLVQQETMADVIQKFEGAVEFIYETEIENTQELNYIVLSTNYIKTIIEKKTNNKISYNYL